MESVANAHPRFLFELLVAHLIDLKLKADKGVSRRLGCGRYCTSRRVKTLQKKKTQNGVVCTKDKER